MKSLALTGMAAAACALAVPALAQDPLASPDRPDQRPATVETQTAPPELAQPEVAEVQPFILRAVSVEGSSLPLAQLKAAFDPFVGQRMDQEGLKDLQRALALAYAESDIALPLARFDTARASEGVIAVRITEAWISGVNLKGDVDGDMTLLQHYAAALTTEQPLSRRTAERYLSLIGDIPGVKVKATQRATNQPGALAMVMDVEQADWETTFELGSRGSQTLGRVQAGLTVDRNGLFRRGDRTRFTLTVPTELERFQHVTLSHRQPIGYDGLAVEASAGYLRTRPENGVDGDATTLGLLASWPLIRGYRENLVLSGGIDALNSDNAVFSELIATERVRALRGAAAWSRVRPHMALSASLVASHGVDGLGASAATPLLTDLDFRKVNLRLRAVRSFGQQFRVTVSAAGQYSSDATPASERFALGGEQYGKGFPAALISGDTGWGAAAELAWRPGFVPAPMKGSELYVFGDGGGVELNDRAGLTGGSAELGSAGLGVRLAFTDRVVLELEGAKAFKDPRPGDDLPWRAGFAISARF